jgi:hypothetical protein
MGQYDDTSIIVARNFRHAIWAIAVCGIMLIGSVTRYELYKLPQPPPQVEPVSFQMLREAEQATQYAIDRHRGRDNWQAIDYEINQMLHERIDQIARTRELIAVMLAEKDHKGQGDEDGEGGGDATRAVLQGQRAAGMPATPQP